MKFRSIILAAWMPFVAGCAIQKSYQLMEPVGFIERRTDHVISDDVPFQYAWLADEVDDKADRDLGAAVEDVKDDISEDHNYKIYIAPVNLSFLPAETLENNTERKRAEMLAEHFKSRLKKVYSATEQGAINITPTDIERDALLTLEIAFAEIKVGRPAAYAAALTVPLPGVASALDANDSPRMAIEGRLLHSESGEAIAEFADRKIPKIRVIDLKKAVSKNYPLREIINDWCQEIVHASQAGRKSGKIASQTRKFSLLPW